MSRRISLYVLLGTIVLIGVFFYQVIQPFVFSLLFATVLAVLFRPFYQWVAARLGHRPRVAAMVTTIGILLLILLPLGGALIVAGVQLIDLTKDVALLMQNNPEEKAQIAKEWEKFEESPFARTINSYYYDLSPQFRERLQNLGSQAADGFVKNVYERTLGLVGDAFNFVIGIVVTAMALYYMLADGSKLLRQGKELLPLGEVEEDALIDQFGRVCRGVVMGTVVAALGQALLAGVGFLVAGVPNVLLLMAITMFCAFIPFVGAGTVVTFVSLWLALDGHYLTAGLLFIYNIAVVSTMDNVVRAMVIGSEARMNPLVAFITVVGALQLIGLWGIFVGPLIAAFFYTLLKLLREKIVGEEPRLQVSDS